MRSSSAHVFVDDLAHPVLEADDEHHLGRVLRLRPGEVVSAGDGAGSWRPCAWRADLSLEPTGEIVRAERPAPPVTVGVAVLKGDRTEWVVQKLTELGVDRVVPLDAARGTVRWDGERARRHLERLRRVAREASMQSRRLWLPEVAEVTPVAAFDGHADAALAEPDGPPPGLSRPTVLVGPEGGWDPQELGIDLPRVGLGPTVLRAETAAVTAAVLLCAQRAGLVKPGR